MQSATAKPRKAEKAATRKAARNPRSVWGKLNPPPDAVAILESCPSLTIASTTSELIAMACGSPDKSYFEVAYDVKGRGRVVEATVSRVRNGIAANYVEPYMRRRDPDCMVVADDLPTDKPTYKERYKQDFKPIREQTFQWLKGQPLVAFGFVAGGSHHIGVDAMVIAPANAGFFAFALALLQGIVPYDQLPESFSPGCVLYVAPPFRHTHFEGRQLVVHRRSKALHELFAYNLYPGPSAKKGIYGLLLGVGEREKWVTAHCSTVQVTTPYDNIVTFMHEGASGGGKSEMLEQAHRELDGRLLLGENVRTGERRHLAMPRSCQLTPVTDDMALCHPSIQNDDEGRLTVQDAENAWFVRVNHIEEYGTDINLEKLTSNPPVPLLFLSVDAVANSRAMIWEHVEDAPGKPCPNPRVVIPRNIYPGVLNGPVSVDIRSFGVRCPPCSMEHPSYGIMGLFHVLPPALSWLWRLVAPRGYANPSITQSEALTSEGVGSFWPFATGRMVNHANLLLDQFETYTNMLHILCPNQHLGAWRVGFMPQWIAREYLARRGHAPFRSDKLKPARCSLLGYAFHELLVEGVAIPRFLLQVDTQPEVGEEIYDIGAGQLRKFFNECLRQFLQKELTKKGREIIECCLDRGTVEDFERLIPTQRPLIHTPNNHHA